MKTLRSLIVGCCISSLSFAAGSSEEAISVDDAALEAAAAQRAASDAELLAAEQAQKNGDDAEFAAVFGARGELIETLSDDDLGQLIVKTVGSGDVNETDGAYRRCRESLDENGQHPSRWTCFKYSIRRLVKDSVSGGLTPITPVVLSSRAVDELLSREMELQGRDDAEFEVNLGARSDVIEKLSDEENVQVIAKLTGAVSDPQTDGAYKRCRESLDENGEHPSRWTCFKYSIRRWAKDNL